MHAYSINTNSYPNNITIKRIVHVMKDKWILKVAVTIFGARGKIFSCFFPNAFSFILCFWGPHNEEAGGKFPPLLSSLGGPVNTMARWSSTPISVAAMHAVYIIYYMFIAGFQENLADIQVEWEYYLQWRFSHFKKKIHLINKRYSKKLDLD